MAFTAKLRVGDNDLFDEKLFQKPEAAKFKTALALRTTARIAELGLDVRAAALRGDCTQADIKRLRKGEIAGYSLEELRAFSQKFGVGVHIAIAPPSLSR